MSFKAKNRKILFHFLCLGLLVGGGCGFIVEDDGFFVEDDDGYDSYTIQEAMDAAQPGDTVFIGSGVYSPSTTGDFFPLYMKDGVNLQGEDAANTYLDAEGNGTVLNLIDYSGTISGFTITNGQSGEGGGIYAENSSGNLQNLYLTGNEAYNLGSAIFMLNSSMTLSNLVVSANFAASQGAAPAQVEISASDLSFVNNVVARGDADGVRLSDGASGTFENNIFYQNGSDGFGVGLADLDAATAASLQYNISFDNEEADYYLNGDTLSSQEANSLSTGDLIANNFSVDPLFFDPASNDYFLENTSPAINAGDPNPAFDNPDGSRNDIGAYGGPGADGF